MDGQSMAQNFYIRDLKYPFVSIGLQVMIRRQLRSDQTKDTWKTRSRNCARFFPKPLTTTEPHGPWEVLTIKY